MDQPKPGNFIAYLNRDKQHGDKRPTFDGRLSLPGQTDELRFALWAHEYPDSKSGKAQIMFNGQAGAVATSASPLDQVAALMKPAAAGGDATFGNLTLAPHQLVLFPNGFKGEDPAKDRPDYWGAFNPGNGQAVVRISAWAKKDRNGNAMLAGATSHPLPGKSEAAMQAEAPTDVLASVEQPVVKPVRGKAGRG